MLTFINIDLDLYRRACHFPSVTFNIIISRTNDKVKKSDWRETVFYEATLLQMLIYYAESVDFCRQTALHISMYIVRV